MIGDEDEVDVSRTPLRKHRLTLALVRYHSIFAINSVAVAVLARRDEWVEGETRLVGSPVNEDVGVFTNDIVVGRNEGSIKPLDQIRPRSLCWNISHSCCNYNVA